MATTTTRLGLRKPAGTDAVSVVTDLDNNYDILDNAAMVNLANVFTSGQTIKGDANAWTGYNAANNVRYLIGLRSDVTGNADDLIFYTYGFNFRFYNNGAEIARIANDGMLIATGEGRFGRGALGGNAIQLRIFEDGVNAFVQAYNPGAAGNWVNLIFRPSSHVSAQTVFQNNGGGTWGYFTGTTVANTSSLFVNINSIGDRQIKAAAINTGPGGVGRVLYVDN